MTRQEALAEARKRWGPKGWVSTFYEDASMVPDGEEPLQQQEVGLLVVEWDDDHVHASEEFLVKGSGDSWEAAFLDADRRAK